MLPAAPASTAPAPHAAPPDVTPQGAEPTPPVPAPSGPPTVAIGQQERRLVTVLFCDLVGFTPISEQLDPEEVRDIQAEYFAHMAEQVERYGGIVEKYAGDAVLALFGVPIAHGDDAERAILCALGMQAAIQPVAERARERWQVDPSIRVGVNTGEVVSGSWDASGRQDVAVTGDAVNTAARIQAVAEAGEVLAGSETMRLTRRRIRFGEKREVALKGKAGTVQLFPALGLREQFGERWEMSGTASPLVGRDRELVELLDVWVRAQGGEGQLVTVIGDAGVGKSRLISELLDRVSGAAFRVVRGRCLSYGQEISLWLLADVLRGLFGIGEGDSIETIRATLQASLGTLLSLRDSDTRSEALDVIGETLGLPPGESLVTNAGAQIRRQTLIRSLRSVFSVLSQRVPTVLVLEDLHWIDEASQDVLREILSDIPGLRMLVLAVQRPGWTAPWSEWGWTERISLRPLGEKDAALLAGSVLGGMNLSPELQGYVAERAGGNPFFVEEMLRALEESGGLVQRDGAVYLAPGAAERLPSTLTEVLLARLDRLEGQVRSVAQVASVIGRSFAVKLLAQVMAREVTALETPLSSLQQAEIAFPKRGSDLEYVFKHVSMREVAYNTLVLKRRQQLHLETARAIALLYPTDEYVEIIAYHYSKTDEHADAAIWLERAGDRAAATYTTDTAVAHYRAARKRLELCDGSPQALARVDEKLGTVVYAAGRHEEALELLERAANVYRDGRDLEGAGRCTAVMGVTHRYRGTPHEGIVLVQPMIDELSK
ncbi:MAG: ATP-binding protein, partial [Chloroflexota bacterium]